MQQNDRFDTNSLNLGNIMKMLIALFIALTSIANTYSSCENGPSARITRDAIKDIQRGMEEMNMDLGDVLEMNLSDNCGPSWIRKLFPSMSGELRKTLNPKNHCGIEIIFESKKEMKNFFANYLEFNRYRDHFVAFDLFSDKDVAVCGALN